jgi:FdhD protein
MPQSDPTDNAVFEVQRLSYGLRGRTKGTRVVPEETPIVFTYNGTSYAVMMASATDLEDFAYGFSLTEGVISSVADVETLEIVAHDMGVELQIRLVEGKAEAVATRKRAMAGPTGCGLCGIESLEEALRVLPKLEVKGRFTPEQVKQALAAIAPLQPLNQKTHAVHAAAFWTPDKGIVALREDVGRHNALDKLAGSLLREGVKAADGIVVLTSRVSIELVQKAAVMGAAMIAAISAPTALAVRSAGFAGITLVAVGRDDGFEVFSHAERIGSEKADVVG